MATAEKEQKGDFKNISKILITAATIHFVTKFLEYLIPNHRPVSPPGTFLLAEYIPSEVFRLIVFGYVLGSISFARKKSVWPFGLAYLVPFITWYVANKGNYWMIIWMVFGTIPLLEFISGFDKSNPTLEETKELLDDKRFKYVTLIWLPVQTLFLLWACWAASTWSFSTRDFILFSISVGFSTGILGINISHELIHKNNRLEVMFGKALLIMVFYGHWYVEHLWGHHKNVSTPHDPASARLGENFYSFWLKSVVGTWKSAWELEKMRLEKLGLPVWTLQNEVINLTGCSIVLSIAILIIFGKAALLMFLGQAFTAFSLLEIVNYIEHYGLERNKDNDNYEPVNVMHSWNADTRVTNFFLFKLQRHSDHHAYASRRYQVLRTFEESPQMPTGYGGMVTMALIPPIWFSLMNPRVEKWKKEVYSFRNEIKSNVK